MNGPVPTQLFPVFENMITNNTINQTVILYIFIGIQTRVLYRLSELSWLTVLYGFSLKLRF